MKYDSVLDQQSISGKIVSLILCVWKPCYMKSGHICRNTFNFLHGAGKHKVHVMKNHFLDNGLAPREHGNTGNHPKHALTLGRILGIHQFVKNYAEQNTILLPGHIPGFKRDYVKVLFQFRILSC